MLVKTAENSLTSRVFSLEPLIGNTPLFPISGLTNNPQVSIHAKLEWQQFGNSVKARPAFNIIREAILNGELDEDTVLLDASSGNTAVAYGAIGAALGLKVAICLPENASSAKKRSLEAYGVNIIYTSRFDLTDGAQEKAVELKNQYPDRFYYADQYANPNNWKAHYKGTANEIFEQTRGNITHLVVGLGTTGTFTGTARRLKEINPNIEVIAIHPDSALHGLEGWKHLETAKVPQIYDDSLADRNITVSTEEAFETLKTAARTQGLVLSASSAANLAGAIKVANEIEAGTVVTVFPDHGSNYPELLKEIL